MAKRKEVCIRCGNGRQELHSMCISCHEQDLGERPELWIAKTGNDNLTRCDEKDCWVCDSFKWEHVRSRPPKYTKKELINRAKGRYGRGNKQSGAEGLEKREAESRRLDKDKETLEKPEK